MKDIFIDIVERCIILKTNNNKTVVLIVMEKLRSVAVEEVYRFQSSTFCDYKEKFIGNCKEKFDCISCSPYAHLHCIGYNLQCFRFGITERKDFV